MNIRDFLPLPLGEGRGEGASPQSGFWRCLLPTKRQRLFAWPHELKEAGVLGINHRNKAFIQESNPRALYPRVDDKTITKQICHEHGIPVPETFAVIRRYGDVRRLAELIGGRGEFVVKPASGAAGRGIVVIACRNGDDYET